MCRAVWRGGWDVGRVSDAPRQGRVSLVRRRDRKQMSLEQRSSRQIKQRRCQECTATQSKVSPPPVSKPVRYRCFQRTGSHIVAPGKSQHHMSTPQPEKVPSSRPSLEPHPLQHLCLPVLRQQFPFPSSLLFPLLFFPSHWLGPLIVSGTCPQEP